jgi:hypothetical protein
VAAFPQSRSFSGAGLALLASACVDTTKPTESLGMPAVPGAVSSSGGQGSLAPTPPGEGTPNVLAPPRASADCSGYPRSGAEFTLDAALDSDPAGPVEESSTGPYRWDNVTILGGGFVSGIVFSQAAPNLIYARTDVGGAYRFDVTQERWLALTDWIPAAESNLMGIESIATDPVDPAKVYLAAGTYLTAGPGQILSSNDYGRTFERHAIPAPMGGNANGRSMGERLAVDPNQPSTLYFGSRNDGLFVSRDSARTWQLVTSFPVLGALDLGVSFVLFDAGSGAAGQATPTLYVGVARLAMDDAAGITNSNRDPRNPVDALYRSQDAGQSWQALPGQPGEMMPHHAALDGEGRLYLTYSDRPGPNDIRRGAVYRFDTTGERWLDISPARPADQRGGFAGLSVDAQRPGVVMVSTLDVWAPDEIYRSSSAGDCWTPIGPRALRDARGAEWVKFGSPAPNATGWMGDFEIDPFHSSRALYITGQGIWWSDDVTAADAAQATNWSFRNEGLEETVALGLVSPPDGARLLSAVGDIAGFRHDDFELSPPSGMYENPRFGNTTSIDFAEAAPNVMARVGTNARRRGAFSTDGGTSWTPFATEPPGTTGEGAVAVSADGASIVWDPRGAPPHYTRDQGNTWIASTGYAPQDGNTGALVADRVNAQVFYGRAGNNIFVSRDGGATFAQAGSFGMGGQGGGGGGGARLRAVFGLEGNLWISTNGALWHSSDFAATFERINAVGATQSLGFGQAAPGASHPAVFLAGTVSGQAGIFRSDDAGASWQAIDDPAHRFGFINHIAGDPRQFGRVYLGTGGRGILTGEPR